MSVLIKDMKMPTSCMDCPFRVFDRMGGRGNICIINESITLHAVLDGMDVKFVRMGDCPLFPVPDHGRLIDGDEALAEAKRLSGPVTGDGWDNWGVYALIERQKTIIPADKEDEA